MSVFEEAAMTAQTHESGQTTKLDLHGLTHAEAQDVINAYAKHVQLRIQARAELRTTVDRAYVNDLPLISEATQKQAIRTADARVRLIEGEGATTYKTLAELRGTRESGARSWVNRLRRDNLLFTVEVKGKTLIPSVQLSADGQLNELVSEQLVKPLLAAGMEPWSLWSWLTSPTGLLSGEIPADAIATDQERVVRAVERQVADLSFPVGA